MMDYFGIIILFFASLIGIIIMIAKKLVLLKKGQIQIEEKNIFQIPHLENAKHFTIKNIKKYENIVLVEIVRFYIQGLNFFKDRYQEAKTIIKNKIKEKHINYEKKEISKFLKIIGDYKNRIREIKHSIKKEEEL